MVHYYTRLRYIAFNATWHLLHDLTRTGSVVFNQVQTGIENAQNAAVRRSLPTDEKLLGVLGLGSVVGMGEASGVAQHLNLRSTWLRDPQPQRQTIEAKGRRDTQTRNALEGIFKRIKYSLEQICGGTGTGQTNGLPYCSWEQQMKQYILTFP